MARLNICGFETGDMSETGTIAGTVTVDSATVRTGTYSLKVVTAASAAVHYATIGKNGSNGASSPLGLTAGWFRFYFRIASLPSIFESIVRFCASATVTSATSLGVVTLGIDSSGDVRMYKPGGGTSGIVGRCSINTWYMIEAHVAQNSTCYARINAGTETSLAACGNEVIDYIQLGKGTRLGDGAYTAYFDDIAIDDTAYPGAGQVNIAVPIASGADNAWSASYTNVDEIPHDGNTSYISGGTGRTNFSMQSFATAGGSGNIAAVKASIIARYSNNSNDNYTVSVKSGATYSENSFPTPSSAYTYLARLLTTDPNTGAPWTSAGFDAMYVGVRCSTTYTLAARVTAVYAMVESAGTAPAILALGTAAGIASSTLVLTTKGIVAPASVSGLGNATVDLWAPSIVVPGTAAGVGNASASLVTQPRLAPSTAAGVATAAASLKTQPRLALGAIAGVASLGTLVITTNPGAIFPQSVAGVATASMSLRSPALLAMAADGNGAASAVVSTPAYLTAVVSGQGAASIALRAPALLTVAADGAATAIVDVNSPALLTITSDGTASVNAVITTLIDLGVLSADGLGSAQITGINFRSIRAIMRGGSVTVPVKDLGAVVTYLRNQGASVSFDGKMKGAGYIREH